VQIVQKMSAQGVTHIVECGPGKVLAGLNKRIVEGGESFALTDSEAIDTTIATIASAS